MGVGLQGYEIGCHNSQFGELWQDARALDMSAPMAWTCGLTFEVSGPEPAWHANRMMDHRSFAGQAGGGPLGGRVRFTHAAAATKVEG